MSARTHPRLVGAFVLGAIALVLGAVLLLSGRDWFERRERFSVYFPGSSVRGLNKGAAVTFRGIKVGEVAEVAALATGQPSPAIQIEVVVELVGEVVEAPPGVALPFAGLSGPEFAKEFTARGFRGRLMSQSLLTGQKYIDFEILPDEPARISGIRPRYPELPTTPTAMEKLGDKAEDFMNKLADLPLDQMLENVRKTLESARGAPRVARPPRRPRRRATARRTGCPRPSTTLRTAVADARRLMDTLDGETPHDRRRTPGRRSAPPARPSTASTGRWRTLESTIQGTDEARLRASQTMEELDRTLKALRNLVDYIQTHPEAVVLGKPEGGEEMTRARRLAVLAVAGLVAALPACVSLKRTPEARFFVLRIPRRASGRAAAAPAPALVGLLPVALPGYLERPQLITWVAPGELRIDEYLRWAEPLDAGLAAHAGREPRGPPPGDPRHPLALAGRARLRCRVRVELQRFGPQASGEVVLEGRFAAAARGRRATARRPPGRA